MSVKRLVDWKTLKAMGICYSRQHIGRLEAQGRFPLRVRLGQCRVSWVAEEVDAWIAERIQAREHPS